MAKRELIDTGTDKRYVRRNKLGTSYLTIASSIPIIGPMNASKKVTLNP